MIAGSVDDDANREFSFIQEHFNLKPRLFVLSASFLFLSRHIFEAFSRPGACSVGQAAEGNGKRSEWISQQEKVVVATNPQKK